MIMDAPTRLFVYGTLIDPICQRSVTGRVFPARPARLDGWRRVEPVTHGYPHLLPDPTATTDGVVLDGIDAPAWRALDDYEDEGTLYRRRSVQVSADADILDCEVYVAHRIPSDWG